MDPLDPGRVDQASEREREREFEREFELELERSLDPDPDPDPDRIDEPEPDRRRPRNEPRQDKPSPGRDLSGFPTRNHPVAEHWYRCHQTRLGVWWFASVPTTNGPGGRWDLPAPRGTCYLASTPEGALWEVIGPDYLDADFVAAENLHPRQITTLALTDTLHAADLTAPHLHGYRINGELVVMADYTITQAWANAFDAHGFDGIHTALRFSPNTATGLSLFGNAGPTDGPGTPTGQPVPAYDLATQMALTIIDTPTSTELDYQEP